LNISWLQDFLTLAASGNFTRAAEQRHMTQPAFSRRIRLLEEWLGVTLVNRSTQPALLTESGEWFRTVATDVLARIAAIPDEARTVAAASATTLRFAATHALSFTFLPGWLRGLEAHVTIGPVQLVSDVARRCEALMEQGRVQFLLCHVHERAAVGLNPAAYISIKVGTDTLLPVTAPARSGRPQHVLPGRGKTRVPVLAYSEASGLGRVLRVLRKDLLGQVNPEIVFTADLATVLKTMTIDGRGVAWLPRSLIEQELEDRRLVEAGGTQWHIDLDIRLFRSHAAQLPAAEAFWKAVTPRVEE
jgi:DNA-binding transcriptional LysR family regulator